MPFYIVKEFAKKISGQLATESDRGIYEYFQQKNPSENSEGF